MPYRKRVKHVPLVTIVLLLCGLLPGLVFLLWLWRRRQRYQEELTALVRRWRQTGQPEPEASFFQLYGY